MAKFTVKRFESILQRMINRLVARSTLTDLNETADAKHELAATAREVDEVYFQVSNLLDTFSIFKAKGDDLDKRGLDYGPDAPTRRLAIKATGPLVFSRLVAGPLINIPIGTMAKVPGQDIVVITTAAGNIPNLATDSASISAVAVVAGLTGNIAAIPLDFKGAKPAGVDSVASPSGFVGGQDRETDNSFAQRLADYVATLARGTPQALEFAALNNGSGTRGTGLGLASGQRCVFASTWEDPVNICRSRLYIDDGVGTAESTDDNTGAPETLTQGVEFPGDVAVGGEVYLYSDHKPIKASASLVLKVNGVTQTFGADFVFDPAKGQFALVVALTAGDSVTLEYTWFTGLIAEIQKTIDGDVADRINYPGWRAAGTFVQVLAPIIQLISVDGTVVVEDGATPSIVIANVRTAILAYINGRGIGQDVIMAQLIKVATLVEGVFDFALILPVDNVPIPFDTRARATTGTVDIHG